MADYLAGPGLMTLSLQAICVGSLDTNIEADLRNSFALRSPGCWRFSRWGRSGAGALGLDVPYVPITSMSTDLAVIHRSVWGLGCSDPPQAGLCSDKLRLSQSRMGGHPHGERLDGRGA